jgi:hypothetical protein
MARHDLCFVPRGLPERAFYSTQVADKIWVTNKTVKPQPSLCGPLFSYISIGTSVGRGMATQRCQVWDATVHVTGGITALRTIQSMIWGRTGRA